MSPGAALPALCLLVPGRFGFAVHGIGHWVYGTGLLGVAVHGIGHLVYGVGILIMVVYNRAILRIGCRDMAGMRWCGDGYGK